jgi:hypothetical protein
MQGFFDYLTGSLSSSGACIIVYPLDYLKMQSIIQTENNK